MSRRTRSALLLGLVILLLLAGYLLGKLEDSQGDGPPDVPDSELTPAPSTTVLGLPGPGGSPAATAASSPATSATATRAAAGRDLAADEARGGHTLARHVGKTDDELRARLRAEPDISAASTYPDRATAERVVAEVLTRKQSDLKKWEDREGSRPNLALRLDLGEVIGRSIEQGKSNAVEVEDAVVVLRWAGSDWYVLTSYPEDR